MRKSSKLTNLRSLESIDTELDEIASLLGDLAHALVNFPDQVVVEGLTRPLAQEEIGMVIWQSEWPSLGKVAALLNERRQAFPQQQQQQKGEMTRRSLL